MTIETTCDWNEGLLLNDIVQGYSTIIYDQRSSWASSNVCIGMDHSFYWHAIMKIKEPVSEHGDVLYDLFWFHIHCLFYLYEFTKCGNKKILNFRAKMCVREPSSFLSMYDVILSLSLSIHIYTLTELKDTYTHTHTQSHGPTYMGSLFLIMWKLPTDWQYAHNTVWLKKK